MATTNFTHTSTSLTALIPDQCSLPDWCYIAVSGIYPDHAIGIARNGKQGFECCAVIGIPKEDAEQLLTRLNDELGVTDWQVKCMRAGALMGWDDLAANPRIRAIWHAPDARIARKPS